MAGGKSTYHPQTEREPSWGDVGVSRRQAGAGGDPGGVSFKGDQGRVGHDGPTGCATHDHRSRVRIEAHLAPYLRLHDFVRRAEAPSGAGIQVGRAGRAFKSPFSPSGCEDHRVAQPRRARSAERARIRAKRLMGWIAYADFSLLTREINIAR